MLKKRCLLMNSLLLAILTSGCIWPTPDPTPPPTPTPEISEIIGLTEVTAGQEVAYNVEVSTAATHKWSAAKGTISGETDSGIIYTAPEEAGIDQLTVEITIAGTVIPKRKEITITGSTIIDSSPSTEDKLDAEIIQELTTEVNEMPIPEPVCVLEDFEAGRVNDWFSPDPNVFEFLDEYEQVYTENGAFKVRYNKTDTYQFIAFKVLTDCDFSKASKLQLWVYGDVRLLLKLEDESLSVVDVSEKRGTNPDGWNSLVYDYKNVGSRINLSTVGVVMFFPAPGDARASGEFYFDDIVLLP